MKIVGFTVDDLFMIFKCLNAVVVGGVADKAPVLAVVVSEREPCGSLSAFTEAMQVDRNPSFILKTGELRR